MSTRSWIFIDNGEGKSPRFRGIYCHFDGYLDWVGKNLKEHYDSEDKVRSIIEQGDASSIDETIEKCKFYHRDNNEDLNIREFDDLQTMMKKYHDSWAEYCYLFQDGKWKVYFESHRIIPEGGFILLEEAMRREEEATREDEEKEKKNGDQTGK